jgi:hypothetical protein
MAHFFKPLREFMSGLRQTAFTRMDVALDAIAYLGGLAT